MGRPCRRYGCRQCAVAVHRETKNTRRCFVVARLSYVPMSSTGFPLPASSRSFPPTARWSGTFSPAIPSPLPILPHCSVVIVGTYCAVSAAVVVVAAAQTKKSNQPPRRRRTSEQFIISGSVPSGSTVSETRSRIGGRAALRPTKLQCEVVGKEAPRKRLAQNEAEIKTEREIERKKGSEKKRD